MLEEEATAKILLLLPDCPSTTKLAVGVDDPIDKNFLVLSQNKFVTSCVRLLPDPNTKPPVAKVEVPVPPFKYGITPVNVRFGEVPPED